MQIKKNRFRGVRFLSGGLVALVFAVQLAAPASSWGAPKIFPRPVSLLACSSVLNEYQTEVRGHSPVKDQCTFGTCHFNALASVLEQAYFRQVGQGIEVSASYLSFRHLEAKSLAKIRTLFQEQRSARDPYTSLFLGGTMDESRRAMAEYGLIPEGVWRSKVDLTSRGATAALMDGVDQVILEAIREKGESQDSNLWPRLQEKAENKLKHIFRSVIGPWPKNFQFEGRAFTPHTFLHHYFQRFSYQLRPLSLQLTATEKLYDWNGSLSQRRRAQGLRKMVAQLKKLIDDDRTAILAYRHDDKFVDHKTGLMTTGAPATGEAVFNLPALETGFMHGVQVVGYDVDPYTDEISRWKIKNSWGAKAGAQGYYHMTNDYLCRFADSIYY